MKRNVSNALQSLKGPFLMAFVLALASPAGAQYKQTNLVSDLTTVGAAVIDADLVNPWGVSHSLTSPFWISDAGGLHVATIYSVDPTTGAVTKAGLTVHMPVVPPGISSGLVFNGSSDFVVSQGSASGPAVFIFAGLDGRIYGWNQQVPLPVPPSTISDAATLAATGAPPAVYTGLAIGLLNGAQQLYAANPAGNHIDVYDNTFANVNASFAGKWIDPGLPPGVVPFNIVNINGQLFVSYTPANPTTVGAGVINVFDTAGTFLKRFATGGTLLSPWGMVVAPPNFGSLSNALLVGNFNFGNSANGPGYISAFDLGTGAFLGLLKGTDGTPV